MMRKCIALLGRQDAPTDAVEEYCRYLGEALQLENYDLIIDRVAWDARGWASALRALRRRAPGWSGAWVLVQYTALAWSTRGFPFRFPQVLQTLKAAGARLAVVYHDVEPYSGTRVIDRLRRVAQLRTMCMAQAVSDIAILTVPAEKLSWIRNQRSKTVFIPVGANLPSGKASSRMDICADGKLAIAVFGITGGRAGRKETANIVEAVRFASTRVKNLRLIVLGRHSQDREAELRGAFTDTDVELHMLGVLPASDVVRTLSICDVLLFVRGPISTRRGSAIAGIACGLPVIASEGPETAPPITEAGLALYSPQRKGDLGDVLVRVLEDEHYRASLSQRSWRAQQQYFSWHAIAARYAEFLNSKNFGES